MADTSRGARKGIGYGILAGIMFGLVEIAVAASTGNPPLAPLRMFASILFGQAALQTIPLATAVIVGTLVHLALSAVFGLIYGVVFARAKTGISWGYQAGFGLLYGALIWLVNFQIIARLAYPWFLMLSQVSQVFLHAIFFGLPLALMYAAAERRFRQVRRVYGHT